MIATQSKAQFFHPPVRIPTYPARPMDGGQLHLAADPIGDWYAELKYNGWRLQLHLDSGLMFNRQGEELSISEEFDEALKKVRKLPFEWLDIEGLERRHNIGRGAFIILDYLPSATKCGQSRTQDYIERRKYLSLVCGLAQIPTHTQLDKPIEDNSVNLIASYDGAGMRQLYDIGKMCNGPEGMNCEFYEGIVRKKASSPYPFQLRSPDQTTHNWVKHRWHF